MVHKFFDHAHAAKDVFLIVSTIFFNTQSHVESKLCIFLKPDIFSLMSLVRSKEKGGGGEKKRSGDRGERNQRKERERDKEPKKFFFFKDKKRGYCTQKKNRQKKKFSISRMRTLQERRSAARRCKL